MSTLVSLFKTDKIKKENDNLKAQIQELHLLIDQLNANQRTKSNILKETKAKQKAISLNKQNLTNHLQSLLRINDEIKQTCPSNHLLQLYDASNIDECSRCGIKPGSNTKIRGCHICNYNKCIQCYNGTYGIQRNKTKIETIKKVNKKNTKTKSEMSMRGWIQLKDVPCNAFSNAVQISNNDLILATDKGIYKYNRNGWTLYIKYPSSIKYDTCALCMDRDKQVLYMFSKASGGCKMLQVNMNEKVRDNRKWNITKHSVSFGSNTHCLLIDSKVHIFGGINSNFHLLWNPLVKSLKMMDGFGDISKTNTGFGVVYIERSNRLLLFGGKYTRTIWQYIIDEHQWIRCGELDTDLSSFTWIITNDERYVVILSIAGIRILDIDRMQTKMGRVQAPFSATGKMKAVLMDKASKYEILLRGFVREEFNKNVGNDVIYLLLLWSVTNDIHLFKSDGEHWKIDVETVLGFFEDDTKGYKLSA